MPYKDIAPPAGEKITRDQQLNVPDNPIIPFIRGDGTGPDIWAASVRVFDAAVQKAYGGKKKISRFEVYAGQTAKDKFDNWLPADTVEALREYSVRHERKSGGVLEKSRRAGENRRHGWARLKAGEPVRHGATRSQCDQLRDPERPEKRDARAQRQHHEVYRRRVPRLGFRRR